MPTAPVDDNGTVLYFEDSGAPPGSTDYVTLVLVHGTCFHSAVYRPMIPFFAEHDLRLVLLNLRDYPGSTLLSPEDVNDLRGPSEEAQARAIKNRGLEIAAFLRWFIEFQCIPPIEGAAGTGGVSLLAWSGGTCPTAAMFAHADKLPVETRKLLDTHLRSYIMYDPSGTIIGQPRPPGLTVLHPRRHASLDEQVADMALAVGSYYPPFTFPAHIDPPPVYDPPRRALHLGPDPVDPKHTPTTSRMSPEVLRSLTNPAVMAENQHLIWTLSYNVYRENLRRCLYDCRVLDDNDGSGVPKKVWPNVRVQYIWCDMTAGDCAWTAAVIHSQWNAADPEHRRQVEFHKLEGANHFYHWEEPEKFVELLAGLV
ncbi:alpha/beta-hydrolase [Trametes versicolor FP-101664 SS1]|uniref:Alpha/beta-hydrolase n=1 Tax=Trametes versicolor (strain FP-101664) TaxID=717944 RepID=R7S6K9_TRAVS|nr:alpha/beta-hydrolase [Trametes versicolor FP-101664 SS1]EIW51541.1 alpha/beta-hydrolase [Trametes versicolor FP-101664 SS1]